jgi:hypothetical protein
MQAFGKSAAFLVAWDLEALARIFVLATGAPRGGATLAAGAAT